MLQRKKTFAYNSVVVADYQWKVGTLARLRLSRPSRGSVTDQWALTAGKPMLAAMTLDARRLPRDGDVALGRLSTRWSLLTAGR